MHCPDKKKERQIYHVNLWKPWLTQKIPGMSDYLGLHAQAQAGPTDVLLAAVVAPGLYWQAGNLLEHYGNVFSFQPG